MEIGIEEETLQQTAIRRKLGFFGHVMRSDGLENGMMLAHGDGRRRRGRLSRGSSTVGDSGDASPSTSTVC